MTVRWGIIGCGDIVRKRVAGAILDQPDSRLLAACRRNEAKLREFSTTHGVERSYTRGEDLLADPEIDAVYIATPVHLHKPQTVAALAAGKHVLVEKPMALSAAECEEMIAAGRMHGVKLGVAYYRRFYPMVRRMKEIVDSGEIGRPMSVTAVTSTPFAFRPGDEGYWRVIPPEGGGGALMDIGSHRLNLFLHLFGDAAEVKACCDTVAASYEAEDCATLVMRFHTGVHGNLQCYFGTSVDPDELSIIGTKGRLLASPLNGSELIVDSGRERRTETLPPPANLHSPLVADFVTAILENHEPTVSGEEGRKANEVMERAYEEARQTQHLPP